MRINAVILPCALLAIGCGSPDTGSQSSPLAASEARATGTVAQVANVADPAKSGSPGLTTEFPRQSFSVGALLNVNLANGIHTAEASIQVINESGQPAANVEISASFTGGIQKDVVMTTDADGFATATATSSKEHLLVGFSVNGVSYARGDRRVSGWATSQVIELKPCCQGKMADPR